MNYFIRRKSDGHLVAIRKLSVQEAENLVSYLNFADEKNEYFYSTY